MRINCSYIKKENVNISNFFKLRDEACISRMPDCTIRRLNYRPERLSFLKESLFLEFLSYCINNTLHSRINLFRTH